MSDLIERLRDCAKVTFSAGLHGVEADCKEAASILALQYDAEATRAVEAVEAVEDRQTIERLTGDYQFQKAKADRVVDLNSELEQRIARLQVHSDLAQVHIDSLSARLLLLISISERIFASAESSSVADFVFVHRSLIGELSKAIHHEHGPLGPAACPVCFPSTSGENGG